MAERLMPPGDVARVERRRRETRESCLRYVRSRVSLRSTWATIYLCDRSVGIALGHCARDFGTCLQMAANDHLGRRRARAVALLIAAVAAIEARDHAQAALAARGLGVDDRLHLVAPLLAFVGATDVAQIMQGAEDLGETLQAAVEGRDGGFGARARADWRKQDRGHAGEHYPDASHYGFSRQHESWTCRPLSRGSVAAQRDGNHAALARLRGSRSSTRLQPIERLRHNVREPGGRRPVREFGRVNPACPVQLFVEDRLAGAPAGGQAQGDGVAVPTAVRGADGRPPETRDAG